MNSLRAKNLIINEYRHYVQHREMSLWAENDIFPLIVCNVYMLMARKYTTYIRRIGKPLR